MSTKAAATPKMRRVGRILILAGVAVWVPYFVLKFTGNDPNVAYFLPFHLSGVIPGSILSRWHQIRGLFRRTAPV